MELRYLPDDPALVRAIAEWHQREWGHLSARTVDDRIGEFSVHGRDVPLTLVAFLDGRAMGCASLLAHDMEIHTDLGPWLGSVFVLPEARHQSLGRRLVAGIEGEAARLGLPELYLFTEDREHFYAAMGWDLVERLTYMGEVVTIMRLVVNRPEEP